MFSSKIKFRVWEHGDEHDSSDVWAIDEEFAALDFIEQSDETDDPGAVVNGHPATLCVQNPDGAVTYWRVDGEWVPEYDATPIAEPS